MLRVAALVGLSQLVANAAMANFFWWLPIVRPVPEIDGTAAITVVALLMGTGVLVYNKFKR
jgi:hypothetical protein